MAELFTFLGAGPGAKLGVCAAIRGAYFTFGRNVEFGVPVRPHFLELRARWDLAVRLRLPGAKSVRSSSEQQVLPERLPRSGRRRRGVRSQVAGIPVAVGTRRAHDASPVRFQSNVFLGIKMRL